MPTLKDTTTGETRTIHICYQCDPDQYPNGKPIDQMIGWQEKTKKETGCVRLPN